MTLTGGSSREIRSPFQKPRFTAIHAVLHDLDGGGVFDSIRFSARKGNKKVSRIVLL